LIEDFTSKRRVDEGLPLRIFGKDAGQFGVDFTNAGEFAFAFAQRREGREVHHEADPPRGTLG
jgi:hypothetical protein